MRLVVGAALHQGVKDGVLLEEGPKLTFFSLKEDRRRGTGHLYYTTTI